MVLGLFALFALLALIYDGGSNIGALVLSLIAIVLIILFEARPAWKNRLYLDQETFCANVGAEKFRVSWEDVEAVWINEVSPRQHYLYLATERDLFCVSLQRFDREQIWQAIQAYANQAAWHKDAYKKLPAYQRLFEQTQELLDGVPLPLHVKERWLIQALAVAFAGIFLFAAISVWQTGPVGVVICLALAGLCTLLWLLSGTTQLDLDTVVRSNWPGKYQIRWDEVEWIENDDLGQFIVFCASDKRLPIPAPSADLTYARQDKEQMEIVLSALVERYSIEVRLAPLAGFKPFKNTRVR